MADRKISDLTALTTPASGDYLPIVDISEAAAASKNKRITVEELMRGAPDGTAASPGIAFESDPNTGIYSPGADQLAVSTGGTGRLFVDSSGRVGIGTTSPSGNLHVSNGSSGATANTEANQGVFEDSNNCGISILSPDASVASIFFGSPSDAIGARINYTYNTKEIAVGSSTSGGQLVFVSDNNSEKARIDSSGRVGIGTSAPTTLLDVNADTVRVRTARTPASATATGATGEICWDANYIYVCIATNTWKRAALSTW